MTLGQIKLGTNPVVDQLLVIELLGRRILTTKYDAIDAVDEDVQELNRMAQRLYSDPVIEDQTNRLPYLAQYVELIMRVSAAALDWATKEIKRIESLSVDSTKVATPRSASQSARYLN